MIDCFLSFGLLVLVVIIALYLCSRRDKAKYLKHENARPLEERIEEIRKEAASLIDSLPKLREQIACKYPDNEEAVLWIEPLIEYARRLESLAANPHASVQDVVFLADEADKFIREKRLKGINIARSANKLANLLQQRQGN